MKTIPGFTLAELLIALGISGVIATFAIPKILAAQTNGKYKAVAKEAAGTMWQTEQETAWCFFCTPMAA